ncbi:uncharacterized protein LOC123005221 [Tribolium madens]|uniref:uncharacterized protein LOC123005221 n=1 Tax=Tribolium madens TaxID=41895 RepID=UPI001CF74DA3|nr:uncharacterized protein LOC123005221 [Tribolium madens]
MIRERLKFCISRHQQLRRFYSDKLNEMSNLIAGFSLLGCLLGISFAIHILTPYKIKFSENYSINYQLGLSIVRGIVSIASVVVQLEY